RDRAKLAEKLSELASAPDLLAALAKLGEHYADEEPHYKRVLCIEMGAEATRNPAVAQIYRSVDNYALDQFEALFARAIAEGKIAPADDPRTLAGVLCTMGDGLFWRRAIDPSRDAKAILQVLLGLVRTLLNPVSPSEFDEMRQSKAVGRANVGQEI